MIPYQPLILQGWYGSVPHSSKNSSDFFRFTIRKKRPSMRHNKTSDVIHALLRPHWVSAQSMSSISHYYLCEINIIIYTIFHLHLVSALNQYQPLNSWLVLMPWTCTGCDVEICMYYFFYQTCGALSNTYGEKWQKQTVNHFKNP